MPGTELWICCLILRGLNGDSISMRLVSRLCREEGIMFIDGFAIATGKDVCTLDLAGAFAYTVMIFKSFYVCYLPYRI
jgi:hypothetical protein